MRNLFYFGLEPLKSRYTYQLSKEWMPDTFLKYVENKTINFIDVQGDYDESQEIKIGSVLDAVGRGKFAMSQCSRFLDMLNNNLVKNGDILFLQDFWQPGIESILYALDLYGINLKIYAMLHAQSVDEYDFTYPMKKWMRGFELGLDKKLTGIFVGSTIHKEQLKNAGFESPIHVVSLPLHLEYVKNKLPNYSVNNKRKDIVVFTSRLDKEKNPFFMLSVAKKFLEENKNAEWHVTTSAKEFKSTLPNIIEELKNFAKENNRFKLLSNLSKKEYYQELASAKVHFNCSLQDYVSWTVLESTAFGCDVVFPNFRSFPEFLDKSRLYSPFNTIDALKTLNYVFNNYTPNYNISQISDIGRQIEGHIIVNDISTEINIWHELEYCRFLLNETRKN